MALDHEEEEEDDEDPSGGKCARLQVSMHWACMCL